MVEQQAPPTGKTQSQGDDGKRRILPAADSIQSVGGLLSVLVGVIAITSLALVTMLVINKDNSGAIIPLVTSAFGVISAIVGAYLGIKIGTDQNASFAQKANESTARLAAVQQYVPDAEKPAATAAAERAAEATKPKKARP